MEGTAEPKTGRMSDQAGRPWAGLQPEEHSPCSCHHPRQLLCPQPPSLGRPAGFRLASDSFSSIFLPKCFQHPQFTLIQVLCFSVTTSLGVVKLKPSHLFLSSAFVLDLDTLDTIFLVFSSSPREEQRTLQTSCSAQGAFKERAARLLVYANVFGSGSRTFLFKPKRGIIHIWPRCFVSNVTLKGISQGPPWLRLSISKS